MLSVSCSFLQIRYSNVIFEIVNKLRSWKLIWRRNDNNISWIYIWQTSYIDAASLLTSLYKGLHEIEYMYQLYDKQGDRSWQDFSLKVWITPPQK